MRGQAITLTCIACFLDRMRGIGSGRVAPEKGIAGKAVEEGCFLGYLDNRMFDWRSPRVRNRVEV